MKAPFLIPMFLVIPLLASAQVKTDSIQQKLASASEKFGLDSLDQTLPQLPDSLLPSYQKIDSIRLDFNRMADSIQTQYQNALSKIDAQTNKLNNRIDSLQRLNLSTGKYTQRLDSLSQIRQTTESKFTSRLDALKAKTTGKLNSLDLPPEYKEPLQQITKSVDDLNINSDIIKVPELNIPGFSLPKIDGIGDLTSKTGELGNIGDLGNLPKIETPAGDLGQITQQAKGYQEDIKNITQGNLDEVKAIPETIESQAAKIDGIDELQKQSGVMDGYKSRLDKLADPSGAKEKGIEMEGESMNTFVPSTLWGNPDTGHREWVWSVMTGLKKEYKIYKNLKGTALIQYNLFNRYYKAPYVDRLNSRIGFEYVMRKKSKSK